jgi:hypothetical protein
MVGIHHRLTAGDHASRKRWASREATVDTRHLDQALATLAEHKTVWARLPIKDKIQYLIEVRQATLDNGAALG